MYDPDICDGDYCPMNCDYCPKRHLVEEKEAENDADDS
jgi:L-lysine 2,3-aminomutase